MPFLKEIGDFFVKIAPYIDQKILSYSILSIVLSIIGFFVFNEIKKYKETVKKLKIEELKIKSFEEERLSNRQIIKEFFEVTRETQQIFQLTLEKMHVSIPYMKFEMLTKILLGVDKTFIDITKLKLLVFFENRDGKNDRNRFIHIKEEIKHLFIEKVNKLNSFIIKDDEFSGIIKKNGLMVLDFFLITLENKFINSELSEVKMFLESADGLYKLNLNLEEFIKKEYYELLSTDNTLLYMKNIE